MVPRPPVGDLSRAKAFAVIAQLKRSELAKSQCGLRLIAYYESLARK